MSRRNSGRRSARGGGAGPRPPDAIINALAPYSWFDAETYAIDGGSGKVLSFTDRVAAGTGIRAITASHVITQATSAVQVAVPTADALFKSRRSAAFSAHWYQSNSPASSWKCLHDGTGHTLVFVHSVSSVAGLNYILTTINNASAGGYLLYNSTGVGQLNIVKSAASVYTASAGAPVVSTAYCYATTYTEGSSPEVVFSLNGATIASGDSLVAPDTAAPPSALILGNRPAITNAFAGNFVSCMIWDRVLTAAERVMLSGAVVRKYGVAA